jgi:class 3 adenylate cyclase/tetratricopeptide (TPR) repeat protein
VICANCGTENEAGRKFCKECATPLTVTCANCGTPNAPDAKFCGECASPLGTSAAAIPVGRPIAARPGSAPSVDGASPTPVAERRLVTVVFADLVGFTPFSEERDPEAVRELLTRYFDASRLAVERHGGTVEKFIGDAVMAVWGTPTAHEDDAERAVRAALEIVDASHGLGDGIEARAGVMTGETAVTLGAVGQGMVAGDLVNTASRLQSVAAAGNVLVGEATMRAASAAVAFESLGDHELKGKSSPVPAWRALRVVAQRGGQGRADALEPPFVGREEELRLLKDALHGTGREQRVRLISITGPAGIGKSRLAWELEKYLDGVVETVYWHRGRSPSYGEGVAFWALGEMVRRRAGLKEADDEATTRARIGETVRQYVASEEERGWVEPSLLALLGLEPPPTGGRDALYAGWRLFFEGIARQGTTILLFEDLHWADPGLLDFIDHVVDWSKNAAILIVTLARPELFERRPDWGAGKRHFTAIALEPLTPVAMRALLDGLVPGLPEAATEAILGRADGIPLYAVETVRMLVAEGRVERVDDTYRPVGDVAGLAIPDTLRSLIASRLDALDGADRMLVQDASVLGRSFKPAALSAITGIAEAELEPRLRGLTRRELLELVADPRSPERGQYGFIQALIREVAYDTLAKRDRRARHLAAARYFEGLGDDELAGVLASHYLAAYEASAEGAESDALAAQARIALRGAAERAAALGGHEQAVSYLEQALAVTKDAADRADLLERAAESADYVAHYEKAIAFAESAAVARRQAGDDVGAGRATGLLGTVLMDSGDLDRASRVLDDALAALPEDPSQDGVRAVLLGQRARALMRLARYAEAVTAADDALVLAERLNDEQVIAEAFINKASSLDYTGHRHEAIALHEVALQLTKRHGWIAMELRATNNYSGAVIGDDAPKAIALLRDGIALGRRVGNLTMTTWLAGSLGYYGFWAGQGWDEAVALIDDVLTSIDEPWERLRERTVVTVIEVTRGADPAPYLEELAHLATGITDPQILAGYHITLGEVSLVTGDGGGAYRAGLRAFEILPEFRVSAAPLAARGAILSGDHAGLRTVVGIVTDMPNSEGTARAARAWIGGAVAAMDGDDEDAAAGFREAREILRETGHAFERARTVVDAATLLGAAHPDVARALPEARSILEGLGARPYLERLDRLVAQASPAAVRPAEQEIVPAR